MRIGIIGCGYVGGAVRAFFDKRGYDVRVFDIDPKRSTHSREDVAKADIVFICLPTPTTAQGVHDASVVMEEVAELDERVFVGNLPRKSEPPTTKVHRPLVFIKSTVLPGTCRRLQERCPRLRIVSSPEFLTARTANHDFAYPTSIVLGFGSSPSDNVDVIWLHNDWFPGVDVYPGSWEFAELTKYARNTFYAVKVGFWNEVYDLCEKLKVPYDEVREGVLASRWVHPMHTEVPGPDGKVGFGGACLPKDSQSLVTFAEERGVPMGIVKAALIENARRRDDL